jgi:hypothetical protein
MGTKRSGFIVLMVGIAVVAALAASTLAVSIRALAAGGSAPAPVQTVASAGPPNTLTVVGQGQGTATPDTAVLSLGAQTTRPNVHEALSANNSEMQKLLNALHNQGVVDKDIQTQSVSVNETNQCCPTIVTGWAASNTVNVTIHHLANVGPIIAAAVDAVGGDISIGGVNLQVSDPSAAITSARTSAMADAGHRAAAWAGLAGRKLGKLLSLSEVVTSGSGSPQCSGGCGGGGGTPIQAGQTQLTVSLTATYELTG